MTLGSLFDGIGVFPLAGALHGITPVWASEVDPAAIRVTQARFPKMQHLGDIRSINGAEIQPVDIITGGSPCQDLSICGERAGLAGGRSGLFLEMVRVIGEMRKATNGEYPRFVVWENVVGAFSSNGGRDFGTVLEKLTALAGEEIPSPGPQTWAHAGAIVADSYNLIWRVLNARYWGVPQTRTRVFVMADYRPERGSEPGQLCERPRMSGNPEPDRAERACGEFARRPDGRAEDPECIESSSWFACYTDNPQLWIGDGVPWRLLQRAAEYGDVPPVSVDVPRRTNSYMDEAARSYGSTKGFYQTTYRLDTVGALTACDYKDPPIIATRYASGEWGHARRLSHRECLRLQGLPQTWCDVEPRLAAKDTYKAVGNSIALPCAEFLLEALANGA